MSVAFMVIGYLTSMLGWPSSVYYGDSKLDLQLGGLAIFLFGSALYFWCGL